MSEDEELLYDVFYAYSNNKASMNLKEFKIFIHELSKESKTLKNYDLKSLEANFYFINMNRTDKLYFEDFHRFWMNSDRYKTFGPPESGYLTKGYRLFKMFSEEIKNEGRRLDFRGYERLMNYLKRPVDDQLFDRFDANGDGILIFNEFVSWLNWIK